MKKINIFFSEEKNISKLIFTAIILLAFAVVFGPSVYAEFHRVDGAADWGYGNGYGYGYGFGFDAGTVSGFKSDATYSAFNVSGWGNGYGFLAAADSFDTANNRYDVAPAGMADLVTMGVMVPNGASVTSTTAVTFNANVNIAVGGGISVSIPSGTTMTAGSTTSFAALTAAGSADTSDIGLSGAGVVGSMQYGLPSLGLTLSASVSITIPIDAAYEGHTISVYKKTPGGSWTALTTCVVTSGNCTFTTTSLSDFAAAATSVPTGVTATAATSQVTVAWTAVSGATDYNVYKLVNGTYTLLANTTDTSYVATSLANGTVHYFKVSALNATDEESALSSAVSAEPTGTTSSSGGGGGAWVTSATPTPTPTPVPTTITTPTGQIIHSDNTLVRYAGDNKVYVIELGKKRWIPTAGDFTKLGYSWNNVVVIQSSETYADGAQKVSTGGAVVVPVSGGKFTVFMTMGNRGAIVSQLQQRLKDLGYFPASQAITQYFGSVTKAAVIALQKAHGIEQVGYVGPKTRAVLNGQ